MSMMRKLLEAMTKFAGEPEQKSGDQVRGTDVAKSGTKEHPFKGKLVGDSIIKDLAKGPTPKTKEEELAEAYANFMEDDIGVEPKRPGRKSDRPHREYTKHGKPSKRYTTVENTELNEYKKDADNFTADDIKELEGIKDLSTLKARAFALISKPSARPMKPEKVQWFKNRLESLVSPIAVIKLMYDLLLSGEGQRVIGSRSSMGANSYRSRFNEGWNTGNDRVSLPDTPHTYWSGTGALQKEYDALYDALVPSQGKAETIEGEVLRASSKIVYRHFNDGDEFNEASFDQLTPYIGQVTSYDDLAHKAIEFALKANGNYTPNPDWDSLDVMDYGPAEEEYDDEDEEDDWYDDEEESEDEDLAEEYDEDEDDYEDEDQGFFVALGSEDEGGFVGMVTKDGGKWRESRVSGNAPYNWGGSYMGYLTPDDVMTWIRKDYRNYDVEGPFDSEEEAREHAQMQYGLDEGRGDSKGLHKKVKIVKGRDAGKTGYVRQIKTDKLRNRVYLDLDLEDGGQAVVLKQDVRLVKDLAESYTGRETKDGVWRVFKDGQAVAAAGPFKSAEEANSWIKKQNQGVAEARTTWNNDFYVYDPKTKAVKKKFRTHKGAKQYAEANGLKVASAEYYHDSVNKEVAEGMEEFAKSQAAKRAAARKERSQPKEGWESGPEERSSRERDPDAEYDARRQEKADAEAEKAQAQRPQEKYYTLVGRGPNNEPNYAFPGEYDSLDAADAARAKLMADPKTPNPRDIGISKRTRYLDEHWDQEGYDPRGQNPELAPGQKALKGKPVKAKDAGNLAQDALTKAFGGTAKDLTNKLSIRKGVSEGIESTDPVEGAVLAAVQELIQQGHTEVAPEVITNMVVAATSQPFLLKDLVDANNNSPAIQHYVDSINPTKVKFSNEILTVKNEDPMKDKKQAQAGVSSMAARAANRSRLGESGDTPLRDQEDYQAKRHALQQIQMDPSTAQDPQLKNEVALRLQRLNKQYDMLSNKLREFKESRGHKAIATKLGNMERTKSVQIPTPAERQEQIRLRKEKEAEKKTVKEFAAPGATPAAPVVATSSTDAAKSAIATNTLKAASGTTVATSTLDKALDSATQGTATPTDVKALAPIIGVVNKAAQDPKLAAQFKTLATQAKTTP